MIWNGSEADFGMVRNSSDSLGLNSNLKLSTGFFSLFFWKKYGFEIRFALFFLFGATQKFIFARIRADKNRLIINTTQSKVGTIWIDSD